MEHSSWASIGETLKYCVSTVAVPHQKTVLFFSNLFPCGSSTDKQHQGQLTLLEIMTNGMGKTGGIERSGRRTRSVPATIALQTLHPTQTL